ncbi:MAG: BadF/BadG/BcrA/BcrD ATPase family protein [Thermodesulfobacteriota bacterium]|nr:BadF/BadG/BcrA/BcrD ATPase family protein [Thermodesulfobacteriota bacterium]
MMVIDIGGQDSKIIKLNKDGCMSDFAMNDRCAAGTGRFLDLMARALEVCLEDLGGIFLRLRKPCLINSTCTVFTELEVVSLFISGKKKRGYAYMTPSWDSQTSSQYRQALYYRGERRFCGGVVKELWTFEMLKEIF